jgi:hypothetical protein
MLDEVLGRLATLDPRKARRGGIAVLGGSDCEGVSRSAERFGRNDAARLAFAKTWLLRELSGEKGDGT